MITDKLCLPALLYVGFTLTHIVIDLFKKMYNSALLKFILMFIFTVMLNLLCKSGLTVLSWIIVFLPFILLTVITVWLLISLGLSPESGYLKYNVKEDSETIDGKEEINKYYDSENKKTATTDEQGSSLAETTDVNETTDVVVENMFNL